jgi:ureidoglycolate dehydrogenase (NAD+)
MVYIQQALEGALLPVGGHKGYVLALAVELLTATLGGEGTSGPPGFIHPPEKNRPLNFCHIAAAVIPSAFIDEDDFFDQVEAVAARMRQTPPAEGGNGVRIPGERGFSLAAERRANGTPLAESTVRKLQSLANKFGFKMP